MTPQDTTQPLRIDDAVAFHIHRTNRLLLTHLGRVLEGTGLTPEQFFLVMRLHGAGQLSQKDLVDVALGDGPNVSRLVERLVRAGLVDRLEDPLDRRARLLELSAAGTRVVRELQPVILAQRRAVFAGLADEDIATLLSTLEHIDTTIHSLWGDAPNP